MVLVNPKGDQSPVRITIVTKQLVDSRNDDSIHKVGRPGKAPVCRVVCALPLGIAGFRGVHFTPATQTKPRRFHFRGFVSAFILCQILYFF